ncbi:SDR family oxidoreductase [Acerihabitans arboris]|uniref:NAD-dependent epimerase/dehydratase family protein n=1 Tax=Acerihabitans arboris TaxID=2691583 RepID=A0A845SL58_9GAMM|nr:SDR family oxidoreductase [Acerihabitans arboris]NDL63704.1 NAD-dependent epimerase/dehydratase family protein [Acerihabitans arboris]
MQHNALIVGASGVIGSALAERLLNGQWRVYGLSRGRTPVPAGCESMVADLADAESVASALKNLKVDRVFFTAWARQDTERENIRVNGAMASNVLDALGGSLENGHVALVTGLKHYLGPFESYATGAVPATPFREEQGRLPVDNFYYEQEDRLFAAAKRHGFTWSVHRPHTIVGYAIGNAMNMGVTLAAYATLCKHTGRPFIFPGSATQWHGMTDVTDARLLASHLEWAATHGQGQNQDFNVVNGDVFRWQWMWSQIADYFGLDAAPFPDQMSPLGDRMQDAAPLWSDIAGHFGLREANIDKLASWWHTDADLGRPMEILTDMGKSRKAGFLEYQNTRDGFIDLFDRLKAERIIPA